MSKKYDRLRAKMEQKSKQSISRILLNREGIDTELSQSKFVTHPLPNRRNSRQLRIARMEFSILQHTSEFISWFNAQPMICRYCKEKIPNGRNTYHIDHIIPLARWGTNTLSNLCIACTQCNLRKHDRIWEEDLDEIMKNLGVVKINDLTVWYHNS